MEKIAQELVRVLDKLDQRWMDEFEYENWDGYEDEARMQVEQRGCKFIALKDLPTMTLIYLDHEGNKNTLQIKGSQIIWKVKETA